MFEIITTVIVGSFIRSLFRGSTENQDRGHHHDHDGEHTSDCSSFDGDGGDADFFGF